LHSRFFGARGQKWQNEKYQQRSAHGGLRRIKTELLVANAGRMKQM
jgi:hypothetical protein